jgi:hypothetical protein
LIIGPSETTTYGGTKPLQVYNSGDFAIVLRQTAADVELVIGASSYAFIYTPTNHELQLGTNNTTRWTINTSGHLVAFTDNTYDIGASGANRPRTGYFGTAVNTPLVSVTSSDLTLRTVTSGSIVLAPNSNARITVATSGVISISGDLSFDSGRILTLPSGTIDTDTTTGLKIGTATTQKIGLWNATPIVQPSSTGETTGWTSGGGSAATSTDTYTGNSGTKAYTVNDIVKHLKAAGILAAS